MKEILLIQIRDWEDLNEEIDKPAYFESLASKCFTWWPFFLFFFYFNKLLFLNSNLKNIYFLKKHMGDTVLVYSVPPLYMVTTKFVVLLLFSGVLGELLIIEMDDSWIINKIVIINKHLIINE